MQWDLVWTENNLSRLLLGNLAQGGDAGGLLLTLALSAVCIVAATVLGAGIGVLAALRLRFLSGVAMAVGARDIVDQAVDLPPGTHSVNAPARILKAGLPLVRKVDVAIGGKHEIVGALQPLAADVGKQRFDLAALRVEHHESQTVVGDEDTAVPVNLQAVGPAVIFGEQLPVAFRRNAQDTPIWDVYNEQIALAIERGALQEAVQVMQPLAEGPS